MFLIFLKFSINIQVLLLLLLLYSFSLFLSLSSCRGISINLCSKVVEFCFCLRKNKNLLLKLPLFFDHWLNIISPSYPASKIKYQSNSSFKNEKYLCLRILICNKSQIKSLIKVFQLNYLFDISYKSEIWRIWKGSTSMEL